MSYAYGDCMARQPDRLLAAAFAKARDELKASGVSEDELAVRLGVKQPTVNRWANAERSFELKILPVVDELCGQSRGYVLRLAGYVSDEVDIRAAIMTDPSLDEAGRDVVLHAYDYARSEAKNDARPSPPPSEPIDEDDIIAQINAAPRLKTEAEIEAEGIAVAEEIIRRRRERKGR